MIPTSPHHSAALAEDGYLAIDEPIVGRAALAELEALLDPLFARWASLPDEFTHDLAMGTRERPGVPEVIHATRLEPRLRRSPGFRQIRAFASSLFDGRPVRLHFDHAIAKPTGAPATAWHQDVAFDRDFDVPMATVWLPFVDVDARNGAMQFVPGSHLGPVLDHVRYGRDGLRADPPAGAEQITVAVPAGGLCVHTPRTLHAATANDTGARRLAWVMKFVPDDRAPLRRAASELRRRADDAAVRRRVH